MTDYSGPEEAPYRFLQEVAQTMVNVAESVVARHERARLGTASYRSGAIRQVRDVPFAETTLSDQQLVRVIELLETQSITIAEAADYFGFPLSLLKRELANYARRYELYVNELAGDLGSAWTGW